MSTQRKSTTQTLYRTILFRVTFDINFAESDRFDKDFAVADAKVRQQTFEKTQDKYANLRQERYLREAQRFEVRQ